MKEIEKSGMDKAIIQKIINQTDTTKGKTPVVVNGETYTVKHEKEYKATFIPDCSNEKCNSMAYPISDCCKKNNWPVGKPVLVCDSDGNCCYCHCK